MAFKTKFISAPNASFNPDNNHMSPEMAAAPYQAQAESAGRIGNALQGLGDMVARMGTQEEKVDDLYVAQSRANFEIGYNEQFHKLKASAKPNGDLSGQTNKLFTDMAKPYYDGSPNEATTKALYKSFLSMHTGSIKQAQNAQFGVNEAGVVNDINTLATKSASLLGLGAVGEPIAQQRISDMASAAIDSGYNIGKINKAAKSASDQIFLQSRLFEATTKPFELLKKVTSGEFAEHGHAVQKQILNAVEENIGGMNTKYKKDIDELNKGLIAGTNPTQDLVERLKQAGDLISHDYILPSLNEKKEDLVKKVNTASSLMLQYDKLSKMTPSELGIYKNTLQDGLSKGEIPLDIFTQTQGMIANREKRIKEDPLAYFSANSVSDSLRPIPQKGTKVDSAEWQSFLAHRMSMSDKGESTMGLNVPPLQRDEVSAMTQGWDKLTYGEKVEQLKMFGSFGAKGASQIADLLTQTTSEMGDSAGKKSLSSLPMAIRLFGQNDNISQNTGTDILKGSEKLNAGTISFTSDEKAVISADMKKYLGDAYVDEPIRRKQIMDAATSLLAERKSNGENPEKLVQEAVQKVGGFRVQPKDTNTVFSNGTSSFIVPRADITQDDIKKYLVPTSLNILPWQEDEAINNLDLANYGNGVPMTQNYLHEDVPLDRSQLKHYTYSYVGDGKYALTLGDSAVYTKDPKNPERNIPYIIDLKSYFDVKKPLTKKG